ncbi:ABC transporter permease subunit [Photobacterium sp. ZSDE20]|uniref:sn-glycerol-3-phosphate transport system permease protein UgpE n=1 Tax=Photobacterium pectinilyticum TaxID=2906793 RepID=A0ABT1N812_9GAMM|nr:ABC transporter permease subunit [Photobacterium sp. ZSDE20]MCQ1060888.1 ABC transporter permease subunit [Photobacterium sp. ZSDE20]MDD1828716.1 ABC transporter permease subunit [Photobacterium sp. ZSDE20]
MIENSKNIDRVASIILFMGMVFVLLPIYLVITTATHSYETFLQEGLQYFPGPELINNLRSVMENTNLVPQIGNSIIIALMSATGKTAFSFLAAFGIVYFRVRYGTVIFFLILMSTMVPLDLRIVASYEVASNILAPLNTLLNVFGINALISAVRGAPVFLELSLIDTYFGMAAPILASGTGTFLFRQSFKTIPPSLINAATMDGAGPIRFMIDILLPISKTSIISLFVLMFMGGWNQYMWPLVVASKPEMETALIGLVKLSTVVDGATPDYPMVMAGAILVNIIPILMIVVMQKYIVKGLTLSEK